MTLQYFFVGIFTIGILSGCAQNAALLGPAYTIVTSGNTYHAAFAYGTNRVIKNTTGKSTTQNIKDILDPQKKDAKLSQSRTLKEFFEKIRETNEEELIQKIEKD